MNTAKIGALSLGALLLTPVLLLTAIPNTVFGYSSSADGNIINMGTQAGLIGNTYASVNTAVQNRIDAILTEAEEANRDAYDDTEVIKNTGNINSYWLAAITSASHSQDLFGMTETSLKEVVERSLEWSAEIVMKTVGEGESAATIRVLKVTVTDLTPDALMNRLGFTQQQKIWAGALYETTSAGQFLSPMPGDAPGGSDYGDVTLAGPASDIDVVYYNQTDSRWGSLPYGSVDTIYYAGCGPTAMAIVVATLTSNKVTPPDVADWAAANGYCAPGDGSYHSLIPGAGAHYGLTVTGLGRSGAKVLDALRDGKLVVSLMSKGHFTKGGHFIVLRGVTATGKILVADPASRKRSGQEWALSIITNEARRDADAGGPFWAISP